MADWTNGSISRWTQCVWKSWFENIAEKAEAGKDLDDVGKAELLKEISSLSREYAKEINDYR